MTNSNLLKLHGNSIYRRLTTLSKQFNEITGLRPSFFKSLNHISTHEKV